ncbi:hypothetical protein IAI10_09245 [Clostridium sp. 19966]|uniref:hypothetical protein n=1 Tax=Clostridium sp. 19966 TaxID=2768166 RepID=UPI0028DEC480|nr:hypothetical protein [Clostridium sp. 19966]MDT8716843.1 hypothetical protein [Clostridium sp. 19966]
MSILAILGTVHSEDMRKESNYPLEKMAEIIERFQPDAIFGEVRPENWAEYCKDKSYDGYLGPNEYRRFIIPYCEKRGIKFVPVDWFEDDMVGMDYYEGKSEEEKLKLDKKDEEFMKLYMDAGKKSAIPFNSFEANEVAKRWHDFADEVNHKVNNVYWICRNELMIMRIKNALKELEGKKVLCTVGAEHTYFYYDGLKALKDWELVYPIKA